MIKILLLLLTSMMAFNVAGVSVAPLTGCESFKDDLPVQAGGRVKPYYVLAKDSVKFLTGKSKYNKENPSLTICKLTLAQKEDASFPILVEHIQTKELIGLKAGDTYINSPELMAKNMLIRSEYFKQKENNSFKKDLSKLLMRMKVFTEIIEGTTFTVFADNKWQPFNNFKNKSPEEVKNLISSSKTSFIKAHGDDYLLELTYVKSHIFSYALLVVLLAIFLTVLFKQLKYGVIAAAIVILVELTGLVMRVMISGRAPITNMYETVLFSGFGCLIISLGVLYFKRDKIFLIAGLGYNMLCLFMMMFANNMLNSSISPLVPVLRDNFWLSTHVTTIILSYAALALSWLVANITLFKMRLGKLSQKDYRYYQGLIYTCIKVGIVLLATGIILGGVWADYSWGRFWGWDPKETWSLIVLLFYVAVVHGRYSNWINTHRFVMLSAAGFMTVMMAWFGVNYILAAGLHSYGFSEGGAIFLGTFFLIQITFLVICSIKNKFKEN